MAATMRMISVTSCNASQTNCRKLFGGLGGITLEPNILRLCSMSVSSRPEEKEVHCHHFISKRNTSSITSKLFYKVYIRVDKYNKIYQGLDLSEDFCTSPLHPHIWCWASPYPPDPGAPWGPPAPPRWGHKGTHQGQAPKRPCFMTKSPPHTSKDKKKLNI